MDMYLDLEKEVGNPILEVRRIRDERGSGKIRASTLLGFIFG